MGEHIIVEPMEILKVFIPGRNKTLYYLIIYDDDMERLMNIETGIVVNEIFPAGDMEGMVACISDVVKEPIVPSFSHVKVRWEEIFSTSFPF